MTITKCAILAVVFSGVGDSYIAQELPLSSPSASERDSPPINGTIQPPMRVRFHLADGILITGELSKWDETGFDGSFGRRLWIELKLVDTWKLYQRVMNRDDPGQWITLGGILLRMDGGEKRANQAFHHALRMDEALEQEIATARANAQQAIRTQKELAEKLDAEKLKTLSPEASAWNAAAWPTLTADQQTAAVNTMKADASRILETAGLKLDPIETNYFLFYSDLPRKESARWAVVLDKMYARLARIFDVQDQGNIFWGKAVIFVFTEKDRFRMVEAESFNHLAPRWSAGLCHYRGPKVFVNFYRQPDEYQFAAILVHETVHGFVHRYRTPKRLPVWANEGFAEYVAAVSFERSPVDDNRRINGVRWVRNGGAVGSILNMQYADGSWPGSDNAGYSVGYLLVELMIRDRPRKFGDWVNAVKARKNWRTALAEDFGVDAATLVDRFTRFYMVND